MQCSECSERLLCCGCPSRLTPLCRSAGESKYVRWGWDAFKSIQQHCRVGDGGYASIESVTEVRRTALVVLSLAAGEALLTRRSLACRARARCPAALAHL